MPAVAQPRIDRRRGLRVAFPSTSSRPTVTLGPETWEVVDLSPTGLRLRYHSVTRPVRDQRVQGMVHASNGDGAPIDGRIAWVTPIEVGLELDRQGLPVGFVMKLVAQERDRLEA
jgi:hypothetical protein